MPFSVLYLGMKVNCLPARACTRKQPPRSRRFSTAGAIRPGAGLVPSSKGAASAPGQGLGESDKGQIEAQPYPHGLFEAGEGS